MEQEEIVTSKLKDLLACPNCKKSSLKLEKGKIKCSKCKKIFQIKNNIPILLFQKSKKDLFDIEKYYNKIYDKDLDVNDLKLLKKNLPFKSVRQDIIKKFVSENKKEGILLSIGCGIGENEELFSNKGYFLVGTDISFNALNIARKYCLDCVYFQSRAENLPLKSESIDIILSIDMIEHVFDDESILDEIKRVLKKDGILVLTTGFSGKYDNHVCSDTSKSFREDSLGEGGDLRDYGLNLVDRLNNKNLQVIKIRFTDGPLAKNINKLKEYFLKKKHSRMEVITGQVMETNKRYLFYSKILRIFYKLDYLIFGRRKGGLIFIGCKKIK